MNSVDDHKKKKKLRERRLARPLSNTRGVRLDNGIGE